MDRNLYSDLHKDALGFRPSQDKWAAIRAMSDDEFQAEWDYMVDQLERTMDEEQQDKARCIRLFEDRLIEIVRSGAGNRRTAIRWMALADGATNGGILDQGYFEYLNGLPYNYLNGWWS